MPDKFGAALAKLRLRHFEQGEGDVAMNMLEPWLIPVPRTDCIEPFVALAKVAEQNRRGRIGDLHRLGHHVRAVAMARHVQGDCLAVLLEGRDGESESHDDEIDRLDLRRERSNPAALAAAVITDPARAAASEAFAPRASLRSRRRRVTGSPAYSAPRSAGAALVIDEGADAFRRKQPLQRIEITRPNRVPIRE